MSKISVKRRQFQIKKNLKRKKKVNILKEKYLEAKNEEEKKKVLEKIQRISPHYPIENIKAKDK